MASISAILAAAASASLAAWACWDSRSLLRASKSEAALAFWVVRVETLSRLVLASSRAVWAAVAAASASALRVATRLVAASWRALRLASAAESTDSWTPEAICMVSARELSSSAEPDSST